MSQAPSSCADEAEAPTPGPHLARRVREIFASLPLKLERSATAIGVGPLASYPGGDRPTSTVTLHGRGCTGHGEHVGWTTTAHERFAELCATRLPTGELTVGELSSLLAGRFTDPYDRAALEAAAIDLALAQRGASAFAACNVAPVAVRYVVSFERTPHPAAKARELRRGGNVELKIDADPSWDDGVYRGLAEAGGIAVLDFKCSGSASDHERAHRILPGALVEDPLAGERRWSQSLLDRLSVDAALGATADLDRLAEKPAAANIKPARMGGVLEALDCIAACAERGITVYFGGMFEVGVGREQLRVLAALLSPDAPNDIAPLAPGEAPEPYPPRLDALPGHGFGAR